MKKLTTMVLGLSMTMISFAQAGELADRAASLSERLVSVERELTDRDAYEVHAALKHIHMILREYPDYGQSSQLTCLSNGSSGVWEKFYVTDLSTGTKFGGETTKENCQAIIKSESKGMICASNGSSGVWEKFKITKLSNLEVIGGETDFATCQKLTRKSTRNFICVSNGSSGVWEKFTLWNLQTKKTVGGETSIENCLSTIPL